MRSTAHHRDDPAAWDVARPERPSRVARAGVTMAGFGVRNLAALRMVPHPALTLILEFGTGQPIVDDAAGRQQRGSLVAGLGFGFGGAVLARGENVVCVQVRLSPLIALRFWAHPRPTCKAPQCPWRTCGAGRRHRSVSN
ncbi:hypothetical protein [Actinopolymorpha pittospori]|uniref:Uncharacterized protein n=1 Tax=Actinopolymorpha pittospori TaxID=648752 RepID=A0A927MPG5_9ACTN|nr:hypothetical protein [Actinopolymorpha pittospori]MBE1603674.1 hypothetical protein [Actinopolymorpha pittospori]